MSETFGEYLRDKPKEAIWATIITLDDALPLDMTEAQYKTMEDFRELICLAYGHWPVQDQCCIPDHDYCLVCGIPMPNQSQPAVSS